MIRVTLDINNPLVLHCMLQILKDALTRSVKKLYKKSLLCCSLCYECIKHSEKHLKKRRNIFHIFTFSNL